MHYAHNFCPKEITEEEISNEEYYGSYVFDENVIGNRETKSLYDTCWSKLIIIIASKDNINISNYSINVAGGLTDKEYSSFYKNINPLKIM